MKKFKNLQAGGVKTWLMLKALDTSSKNHLNIVYEAYKQVIYSVFHSDMLMCCLPESNMYELNMHG